MLTLLLLFHHHRARTPALCTLSSCVSLSLLCLLPCTAHPVASLVILQPVAHLGVCLQLQEEQLLADMMTPLAALSSLKSLGLQGSDASIVEVTPWHRLTGLTRVDLHGSCVSDLRPLQVGKHRTSAAKADT